MKKITSEMLKIYKPLSGLDWLNYKIVRNNMTAHHIVKREFGGKLEVSNIAPLMNDGHIYLHIIEYKDLKTYESINKLFKYINDQGYEPTNEQREIIEYLLTSFEKEHIKDKTSKGKLLIKHQYLERSFK